MKKYPKMITNPKSELWYKRLKALKGFKSTRTSILHH